MRENGWDSLLSETSSYSLKRDIHILNIDDLFQIQGRSQCQISQICIVFLSNYFMQFWIFNFKN